MKIDPTFDPSMLAPPPEGARWASFDALEPGDTVFHVAPPDPAADRAELGQLTLRGRLVERGSYDAFFQRTYGRESGVDGAGWWVEWEDGTQGVLHTQIHVLQQTPEEIRKSKEMGLPEGYGVRSFARTVLVPAN